MKLLRLFCLVAFFAGLAVISCKAEEQPASPRVQEFLRLLSEKDVQDWLTSRQASQAAPTAEIEAELLVAQKLRSIRNHLQTLTQAIPRAPSAYAEAANRLREATAGYRPLSIFLLASVFIVVGLSLQWLFKFVLRKNRRPAVGQIADTPAVRVKLLAWRLLGDAGGVGLFAVGSFGAFLFFDWPHLLRAAVAILLIAATAWMLTGAILTALFGHCGSQIDQPSALRLLPMNDLQACHLRGRLSLAAGWFAFGYAFIQIWKLLSLDIQVLQLSAYAFGFVLLCLGIEAVWRNPVHGKVNVAGGATVSRSPLSWLYIVSFVALWILWIAGAMLLFWFVAAALVAPLLISWSRRMVVQLFSVAEGAGGDRSAYRFAAVLTDSLLRALIILVVIWWLSWAWGIGFDSLAGGDSLSTRLLRNILKVGVILLVADLVWRLVRTMIDAYLLKSAEQGEPGSKEAIRRAKARTLLPIIRNVTMVFLAVLALMMSLSTLGVDIAPLIASAGVVGVAVGFGAQTVVKDIISGMFYLLDDAFRIGEYIVSGSFKGTVESFSLRSVKLRHHNGPVYTIPFGDLGAVQNMSRDYAIDKFTLTVTYDSDIEKARKLIRQIGEQLKEDPELGKLIIEPMKMQRVDQFGDYGIVLKVKMTTRPGEQFSVRRKAFPLIKKMFDENGIEFASPTVKVAGDDGDKRTAAARHLMASKAATPSSP